MRSAVGTCTCLNVRVDGGMVMVEVVVDVGCSGLVMGSGSHYDP